MIVFKNLTINKIKTIDYISINFTEFFAIIGKNTSGKTTIVNILKYLITNVIDNQTLDLFTKESEVSLIFNIDENDYIINAIKMGNILKKTLISTNNNNEELDIDSFFNIDKTTFAINFLNYFELPERLISAIISSTNKNLILEDTKKLFDSCLEYKNKKLNYTIKENVINFSIGEFTDFSGAENNILILALFISYISNRKNIIYPIIMDDIFLCIESKGISFICSTLKKYIAEHKIQFIFTCCDSAINCIKNIDRYYLKGLYN